MPEVPIETELIAATMIARVGAARSSYVEAVRAAREGRTDEATALVAAGREHYLDGHAEHARLLSAMAAGRTVVVDLLLAHAEDQLMAADQLRFVAEELAAVHARIAALEAVVGGEPEPA